MSDEEWAFCASYLTLMREETPQHNYPLRDLFNDLPPWQAVKQETQRWLRANCCEHMAHDPRALLRLVADTNAVHGMKLEVFNHHDARRGFVLLHRCWVVERSFAWAVRFR